LHVDDSLKEKPSGFPVIKEFAEKNSLEQEVTQMVKRRKNGTRKRRDRKGFGAGAEEPRKIRMGGGTLF
jgi:hypothetical protein